MKRSLSLVLFSFLFLYFGSSALGQSYEIELAVSYDQQYKDTYQQDINNPFESVDARINAIVDGLDKVYSNYGVYFKLVAIEEFGYINLSGTTVYPPNVMTIKWLQKEGACYKRDMVLHLTGSDLKTQNTVGVASGSHTTCASNTFDYDGGLNNFVVISKFQSLWNEIKTAAHELGHGMRLQHESAETCSSLPLNTNSHYFMCQGGGGKSPSESTNYILSSSNANILNGTANGNCINVDNYQEVLCTDFTAEFFCDNTVETICNEDGITSYNMYYKNDENFRAFGANRLVFNNIAT